MPHHSTGRSGAAPLSAARAWWALAVLILAYTAAYVDRTMLSLLVQPIRAALAISDVQFSLLQGLAFAIFYTTLGIPLARLADQTNRRNLILGAAAFWSLATALCGLAQNFGQLFAARVAVGIGEAGLSPAAYSLLGDAFPGPRVPQVLSIYTMAIYVGSGLALIGGGAAIAAMPALDLPLIGHLAPWQAVFPAVGLGGVLVVALLASVTEPPRPAEAAAKPSIGVTVATIWAQRRSYLSIFAGFAAAGCVWNGALAWLPSLFMRQFGWSVRATGWWLGGAILVFASAGVLAGGRLAVWLSHRGRSDANLRVGVYSAAATILAGAALPFAATASTMLAIVALFLFVGAAPYGAAVAALHDVTPNRMRAQVTALYLFAINLAGIGTGPTLVALYARHFTIHPLAAALACNTALAGVIGLLLLAQGLAPYRRTQIVTH